MNTVSCGKIVRLIAVGVAVSGAVWIAHLAGIAKGRQEVVTAMELAAKWEEIKLQPRLVVRTCAYRRENRAIDLVIENAGTAPARNVRASVAVWNYRSNLVATVPAYIDLIPPQTRWDSTLEVDSNQGVKAVQVVALEVN